MTRVPFGASAAENRRQMQNCRAFGLALRLGVARRSTATGIGGSWSRNAKLSSLLTRVWSSRLKSVNSHRDRGVAVAKSRTVVTFGLAFGPPSQQCQRSQGSGGSWSRNAELSSPLDLVAKRRREERGEERKGERIERRDERGEMREERGEERKRARRGEERGKKREEMKERGEREDRREEKREER